MNRFVPVLFSLVAAASGCAGDSDMNLAYTTPARMDRGLVIVLPGIDGPGPATADVQAALDRAGAPYALPVYNWGSPIPVAGLAINQVNVVGNRMQGGKVAQMIVEYQRTHPAAPIYLIGHSGGGGVAVFAAEALPDEYKVDGLILLSASISNDYDLTKALQHTRKGLVNFHNPRDVALLEVGTTIMGNVDGGRSPSAGRAGFAPPQPADPPAKRQAYARLFQVEATEAMIPADDDPHYGSTRQPFVLQYVTPWLRPTPWPPAAR